MKKLYYTDPLAAAIMLRDHNVQFIDANAQCMSECMPMDLQSSGAWEVHPDSYHIFEPQVGDLWEIKDFDAIRYEMSKRLPRNRDFKIIQRNNKPFFWPESEEKR